MAFKQYSQALSKERILAELGPVKYLDPHFVNYNVTAGTQALVLIHSQLNMIKKFEWGLVPSWSRDGKNKGLLLTTNKEGIASKTSFRIPIRKNRCLVVADSYYLWNKEQKPFRVVYQTGQMMTFAGVWDHWTNGIESNWTFSIITANAPKKLNSISAEVPVILDDPEKRNYWLTSEDLQGSLNLLNTSSNYPYNVYRISEQVRNPSYNKSETHTHVPEVKTLFDIQ